MINLKVKDVNLLDQKFKNIQLQTNSEIALIIIEREKMLNTLDKVTVNELIRVFLLIKEDSKIKSVILTGSGNKSFIGGIDKDELSNLTAQSLRDYSRECQKLTLQIEQLGKPVIAAINGIAFDAGLEIVLACSLRIASNNAQFGLPSIEKGYLTAFGGSRRLAHLIGTGRALEMLLLGNILDAEEAQKIGLINQVTRQMELFSQAKELAQKISNNSSVAIKYLLDSFFNGLEMPLEDALLLEATIFALCAKSSSNQSMD